MSLLLRLSQRDQTEVQVTVTTPTTGVAILDVQVGETSSKSPLHWRAGMWTKPPVDIAVDPANGRLQGVQIVLQDEDVPWGGGENLPADEGAPAISTERWSEDRYRDEVMEVHLLRTPDDRLEVRLKGFGEASKTFQIGGKLQLIVGPDDSLVGLRVGPMSSSDWGRLREAAIPQP